MNFLKYTKKIRGRTEKNKEIFKLLELIQIQIREMSGKGKYDTFVDKKLRSKNIIIK